MSLHFILSRNLSFPYSSPEMLFSSFSFLLKTDFSHLLLTGNALLLRHLPMSLHHCQQHSYQVNLSPIQYFCELNPRWKFHLKTIFSSSSADFSSPPSILQLTGEDLKEAVDLYDEKKNGKISANEFHQGLRSQGKQIYFFSPRK